MNAGSAATIDAVLAASPGPTLLDFGAPWCGPCKAISPMIDELAREMAGHATVAKIDVDAEGHAPQAAPGVARLRRRRRPWRRP